jgi:hypothetical protein
MLSEIFLQKGLDDPNQIDRKGEFRLNAQADFGQNPASRPHGSRRRAFAFWATAGPSP